MLDFILKSASKFMLVIIGMIIVCRNQMLSKEASELKAKNENKDDIIAQQNNEIATTKKVLQAQATCAATFDTSDGAVDAWLSNSSNESNK